MMMILEDFVAKTMNGPTILGPRKCERDHAEPVAKYFDYYLGTGRTSPRPAGSLAEALALGGEQPLPADINVTALYSAFPQDRVRGCAWRVRGSDFERRRARRHRPQRRRWRRREPVDGAGRGDAAAASRRAWRLWAA